MNMLATGRDVQQLGHYKGFTILARVIDRAERTEWQVQMRIGRDEDRGFVDKLPKIDRTTSKLETGALNLGLAALEQAHAAIDQFIEQS